LLLGDGRGGGLGGGLGLDGLLGLGDRHFQTRLHRLDFFGARRVVALPERLHPEAQPGSGGGGQREVRDLGGGGRLLLLQLEHLVVSQHCGDPFLMVLLGESICTCKSILPFIC